MVRTIFNYRHVSVVLLCLMSGLSFGAHVNQADSCDSAVDAFIIQARRVMPLSLQDSAGSIEHRLHAFSQWLAENGRSCSTIVNDVAVRYAGFTDSVTVAIDTSIVTFVGAENGHPEATIIMYVSMTCPLCKRVYAELYDSVNSGALKKKVRLGVKPFSGRPWDVALLAARKFGKQAALLRALAPVKDRITLDIILGKADSVGIPLPEFQRLIAEPGLVAEAENSKREGVANGVEVTPTIFINYVRYRSYKDPRWVIDAADFACGKKSGRHSGRGVAVKKK